MALSLKISKRFATGAWYLILCFCLLTITLATYLFNVKGSSLWAVLGFLSLFLLFSGYLLLANVDKKTVLETDFMPFFIFLNFLFSAGWSIGADNHYGEQNWPLEARKASITKFDKIAFVNQELSVEATVNYKSLEGLIAVRTQSADFLIDKTITNSWPFEQKIEAIINEQEMNWGDKISGTGSGSAVRYMKSEAPKLSAKIKIPNWEINSPIKVTGRLEEIRAIVPLRIKEGYFSNQRKYPHTENFSFWVVPRLTEEKILISRQKTHDETVNVIYLAVVFTIMTYLSTFIYFRKLNKSGK